MLTIKLLFLCHQLVAIPKISHLFLVVELKSGHVFFRLKKVDKNHGRL